MRDEFHAKMQEMTETYRTEISNLGKSVDGLSSKLDEHMRSTDAHLGELRSELEGIKVDNEEVKVTLESARAESNVVQAFMNTSTRLMDSAVKSLAERVERMFYGHTQGGVTRKKRRLTATSPSESVQSEKNLEQDVQQAPVQALGKREWKCVGWNTMEYCNGV